ncbi:hypothetical protein Rhe02_95420 [Rhizocola hellebori]|uniref:Serine protease n=1 Tax=Rhizocola hellebori TaxID=1392758 RepID=A0A8J3QIH7_9ACTN|nr:serine protease [Rhizocola hellebori]GIH11475.1 hypothetical protein Rhe02_95420 [Rhizocola hellebori]
MGAVTTLALATAAGAAVMSAPAGQPETKSTGSAEAGRVERVDKKVNYLDGQSSATFHYPGAEYIKVHFAGLLLLPGDFLTVSNPDGTEEHRVTRAGWAMSVTGETAQVQLHRTNLLSDVVAQLGVTIDQVSRGFTEREREEVAKRSRERKNREESVCGNDEKLDAVCYKSTDPVLYKRSKAVARLLIKGTELCTGWRVGALNRMMTNFHCIGSAEEAADTEVWFNYQCAECGGYDVFRPTKVWLSEVLASNSTLDYTLFSVSSFELIQKFGYLELDVRRPGQGEELYIPQHPTGAPAMIALTSDQDAAGNCAVQNPAYDGYDTDTDVSYYCDTEGGSSGSPVLSRSTNKVVALHHFGGCPNSGVRMERIFTEIQSLI